MIAQHLSTFRLFWREIYVYLNDIFFAWYIGYLFWLPQVRNPASSNRFFPLFLEGNAFKYSFIFPFFEFGSAIVRTVKFPSIIPRTTLKRWLFLRKEQIQFHPKNSSENWKSLKFWYEINSKEQFSLDWCGSFFKKKAIKFLITFEKCIHLFWMRKF